TFQTINELRYTLELAVNFTDRDDHPTEPIIPAKTNVFPRAPSHHGHPEKQSANVTCPRPLSPKNLQSSPANHSLVAYTHPMPQIRKLLIANRGEIAVRIIRTCKAMSIATVAVYSDSDQTALFVRLADEAIHIGPSPSAESYLVADKIVAAALRYGFLSENAAFAASVRAAELIFVGPSAESIRAIGDKIGAKQLLSARASTVPLIPGYNDDEQSVEVLVREAVRVGFPVLLKASAGGGGKGMRVVRDEAKLLEEIETAKGESLRSFGSDRLLIERYFESCRHVEVQIMGDQHGHVYHIFERDCSVQRRHQKIIEETPSPALDKELRDRMTATAVRIGELLGYEGAGTIEFILDPNTRQFYFLEMNTRLQVEHPVTEAITGLDLVALQIQVAQGADLSKTSPLSNLQSRGHAIECRLYAEDPENGFLPATGRVRRWKPVVGEEGVRYDTGIEDGSDISIYYDPLIAKLTVHAPTRAQALQKMDRVLSSTIILGLTTNQRFLISVMRNAAFASGRYNTRFVEVQSAILLKGDQAAAVPAEVVIASFLFRWYLREQDRTTLRHMPSGWRYVRYKVPREEYIVEGARKALEYQFVGRTEERQGVKRGGWVFKVWLAASEGEERVERRCVLVGVEAEEAEEERTGSGIAGSSVSLLLRASAGKVRDPISALSNNFPDGIQREYDVATEISTQIEDEILYVHGKEWGRQFKVVKIDRFKSAAAEGVEDDVSPYISPMPCRILKLLVSTGATVKKNDAILTMESMKTEVRLYSRHDGVLTLHVTEGQLVEAGTALCEVK
ncbi:carbamoyl-phosphate synthase L chain, ATP binding domain-containing protein, partial [Endogone sp. FLAS-F59071]